MSPGAAHSTLDSFRQSCRDRCGRFYEKGVDALLFGHDSSAVRTVRQVGDEPLALLADQVMGVVVFEGLAQQETHGISLIGRRRIGFAVVELFAHRLAGQ